ncbi:hypothetical protein FQA39_LY16678 [Lamprigera yunnana]|nr:hypothetical protein FQA39_LY16678 [Lamprigera yunnana]
MIVITVDGGGGGGCRKKPVFPSLPSFFFVSTSLSTTKKWWHFSHLTNLVELTKVSTCVHGSPHFGHESVPLFLLPPPPPGPDVMGGKLEEDPSLLEVIFGGSPDPADLCHAVLVEK